MRLELVAQWRGRPGRATAGGGFSQGIWAESRQIRKEFQYVCGVPRLGGRTFRIKSQLLSSGLMSFSKPSKEVSPFTRVPLMKKLGVELTLSLV